MTHTESRTDVVAVTADMLFAARIRGTAEGVGVLVHFARNADDLQRLAATARLILLDLDARWLRVDVVMRALRADPATAAVPVVAFVSHVRTAAMAEARQAGADRVLARSAFVKELQSLLQG
jgi:CheY-like chemotaxis protein